MQKALPTGRKIAVPRPVVRSLYKSLLKQARRYDANPVLKVYSPVTNPVLQRVLGMSKSNMLYAPGSASYVEKLKTEFREIRERTSEEVHAAFECVSNMNSMASQIEESLPKAPAIPHPAWCSDPDRAPYSAKVQETPKLEVGTLLLSHPLATSHFDRRVVLIVESHRDHVVGLVLDLTYTANITPGNPAFPPVLWDHELCSGGPFHVDMTMPPTATISVLHTGVIKSESTVPPVQERPPTEATNNFAWLFGPKSTSKPSVMKSIKPKSGKRYEMHNLVIPNAPGALDAPLYYSRVESLQHLATDLAGADRKNVRVYWGAMQWPRLMLKREMAEGLWFPVTASPGFFRNISASDGKQKFPTSQELLDKQSERIDAFGADVQPTYPNSPLDHMQCRREPLWDQIMWALGGEYRAMAGFSNPMPVNPMHHRRAMQAVSSPSEDEEAVS